MNNEKVNRKYDVAAMAAISEAALSKGTISLDMKSPESAKRLRLQYYMWRRREQELNGDPTYLSEIVVRTKDNEVIFSKGFGNDDVRAALAAAGVILES
jgi:hypothetical protein